MKVLVKIKSVNYIRPLARGNHMRSISAGYILYFFFRALSGSLARILLLLLLLLLLLPARLTVTIGRIQLVYRLM